MNRDMVFMYGCSFPDDKEPNLPEIGFEKFVDVFKVGTPSKKRGQSMKTGFELTLIHRLPEEEEIIYTISNNKCDMDFDGLCEMFRAIALAAGFRAETVDAFFDGNNPVCDDEKR
jgi:hypothetical protein